MTQNVNIAVKTESGQVKKISHGVIFQPETQFKGGTIKWFDDSKLLKGSRSGAGPEQKAPVVSIKVEVGLSLE